jgi:hypothetical protein
MGHRVARSTIAKIPKEQGIPPSRERPMAWRTFVRAHWQALFAADFFTTEVWTVRGLVTYYTMFVIELHSRRVHVLGSTPQPDEGFIIQTLRPLSDVEGVLRGNRMLICDRDRKWSAAVKRFLATGGVRLIRTPFMAPNCPPRTRQRAHQSPATAARLRSRSPAPARRWTSQLLLPSRRLKMGPVLGHYAHGVHAKPV